MTPHSSAACQCRDRTTMSPSLPGPKGLTSARRDGSSVRRPMMTRVAALVLMAGTPALAQVALFADRGNNAIWHVDDLNGNGVIDEPAEIWAFFNGSNAA